LFDDVAHSLSADALPEQLAEYIFGREQAIRLGDLYASTCNTSPGTSAMYKAALETLVGEQDIIIQSEDGSTRRHAKYMRDSDWIERNRQGSLFSLPPKAMR
jgi:hypothetical protein